MSTSPLTRCFPMRIGTFISEDEEAEKHGRYSGPTVSQVLPSLRFPGSVLADYGAAGGVACSVRRGRGWFRGH